MLLEHLQERTWRESDAVPVALSNSQPHQVWDSARYEITWTNLFYGTSSWRDGSSFSIQVQVLFLTSEADVACCKEHQLSAVFQKKSPPSSRHTGTFLLSYFPTFFQQLLGCTNPIQYFLNLWETSLCHFWGLLSCLPPFPGKLSAPLRHLWGWAFATGSAAVPPHPPDISASHTCLIVLQTDTISGFQMDVQAAFLAATVLTQVWVVSREHLQ